MHVDHSTPFTTRVGLLGPTIVTAFALAMICDATAAERVRVVPGNEAEIAAGLNAGMNIELAAGAQYVLSADEWIAIRRSGVELAGNGATLLLDGTFDNYAYEPRAIHGDVHGEGAAPRNRAIAIYIAAGTHDVTVRDLKIDRVPVPGSVVRSISVVKAADVRIRNVEFTGDTIGPVVDIVNCTRVMVDECNIHDIAAINSENTLDLTRSGTPNLTAIQVDDVDLLTADQRKQADLHSRDVRIVNNVIRNLRYDHSMFDVVRRRLGRNDGALQVDGINLQRGCGHAVLNNVIVNTDEGIDTFGSFGLIRDNVIKLDPLVYSSAGIKFCHGASHNLALENLIVNRVVSTILEASTLDNLTGPQGVYGNVIAGNTTIGSGDKLYRVSNAPKARNATMNFMLRNVGGTYRSDNAPDDETNLYFTNAEEPEVVLGDFAQRGRPDSLVLYSPDTGGLDLYLRRAIDGCGDCRIESVDDALGLGGAGPQQGPRRINQFVPGAFFRGGAPRGGDLLLIRVGGEPRADYWVQNIAGRFHTHCGLLGEHGVPHGCERMLAADFNGDGATDLFMHSDDGSTICFRNAGGDVGSDVPRFLREDHFVPPAEVKVDPGNPLITVKSGDFDGDRRADLLFLWRNGESAVFTSRERALSGRLSGDPRLIDHLANEHDVHVCDYDFDGRDDVLLKLGHDLRRLFVARSCPGGQVEFRLREVRF